MKNRDFYFTNFYEGSIGHYSPLDRKILDVRNHTSSLLHKGDFAGIDGLIRGILYTNPHLCQQVILWRSKWEQDQGTLLHEVLSTPKDGSNPPLSLIQMLIDIAPSVLTKTDVCDYLPLQNAVCILTIDKPTKRPIEIIKLLVEADENKETITPDVMLFVGWRADVEVAKYLLSFKEGRNALVQSKTLFYISRDYFDEASVDEDRRKKKDISFEFIELLIESTAEEIKRLEHSTDPKSIPPPRCCCLYDAIVICEGYTYNQNVLMKKAKDDCLYCTMHAFEVESLDFNKRTRADDDSSDGNSDS